MRYLSGCSGTSPPPPPPLLISEGAVVVCVCVCACLHEQVHACICMCVYVLVSDTAGNIILGVLREDDEWCSALQLFLNSKLPLYWLVMERKVLIHRCWITRAMQGQRLKYNDLKFPFIHVSIGGNHFWTKNVDWLSLSQSHSFLWSSAPRNSNWKAHIWEMAHPMWHKSALNIK